MPKALNRTMSRPRGRLIKTIIAVAAALLCAVFASTRADAGIRIGDWRMVEAIGDVTQFSIHVFYENPRDKSDVRFVSVTCRDNAYLLSIIGICRHCSSARQVPLRVTIDGRRAFDLVGFIPDWSFWDIGGTGDHDPSKFGSSSIEATLSSDQLRALSQIRSSFSVQAPGYATISLQPSMGTQAAFATLGAACTGTRNDHILASQPHWQPSKDDDDWSATFKLLDKIKAADPDRDAE